MHPLCDDDCEKFCDGLHPEREDDEEECLHEKTVRVCVDCDTTLDGIHDVNEDCGHCGRTKTGQAKCGITCPLCNAPADHKTLNETHIWSCRECPFLAIEYYTDKNIDELKLAVNLPL